MDKRSSKDFQMSPLSDDKYMDDRELHINPELLQWFKQFPLFIQYDKGTGTIAGMACGVRIINDRSVERWKWVNRNE